MDAPHEHRFDPVDHSFMRLRGRLSVGEDQMRKHNG